VKVSLFDEQFRPVSGYEATACLTVESGFRQKVAGRGHDAIARAEPFRIRIDFGGVRPEDIRLYAIYMT